MGSTSLPAVSAVVSLIRAMSLDERRVLLAEIKPILGDTLWEEISGTRAAKSEGETPPETEAAVKKVRRPRVKVRRPFWMQEVLSVDVTAKGMDAVKGEWIYEMDGMADSSRPVLLGTRSGPKAYVILTFDKGNTAIVNGTYEIENAMIVGSAHAHFKEVVEKLAEITGEKT